MNYLYCKVETVAISNAEANAALTFLSGLGYRWGQFL